MAQKKSSKSDKTTVRRIKATDDAPKKNTKQPAKKAAKKTTEAKKTIRVDEPASKNPLKALGGYFKGAWAELKQVRWPSRSATWSMTLAVLVFSGIFVVLILLLDAGFKWLFELILK